MKAISTYHESKQLIMKYLPGFMIVFALGLQTLFGQQSSLFVGVNGGANLSKFKYTEDLAELYSGTNSVPGLNGGVSAGVQIRNFTVTTGVQYMQRGGQYSTDNFFDQEGTGFFSAKEKLHYVSIPVMLGYRKHLDDRFGFSVSMGPSFNMGFKGKVEENIEYYGSDDVQTEFYTANFGTGVNDDYRNVQVGFQFSPGLFFDISRKSRLTLNMTWDSGMQDAFNERYKKANTFFDTYKGNQFNQSTMLTIGYEYHFPIQDKY